MVVDLETTGASPRTEAITEIGALRLRGGELLGTFETLVNPGVPIPPMITVLTGITEAMVLPRRASPKCCRRSSSSRDAVIVGHNIRFDCGFLDAALLAHGYPRLPHRRVDTVALARRLVRDEIPNLRLHTLARHFRTTVEPVHRAYADAAATAEVLHAPPRTRGRLRRARPRRPPRAPDHARAPVGGEARAHRQAAPAARASTSFAIVTAGCSTWARRRTSARACARTSRPRTGARFRNSCARPTPSSTACARGPFEAAVRELRLIQRLEPRFNRQSKSWRRYTYLKLTAERFPRLVVTRAMRADGAYYLGPFRSSAAAHRAREAIEDAVPLRRCGLRIGKSATIAADRPAFPRNSASRPVPAAPRSARTNTARSPTRLGTRCSTSPRSVRTARGAHAPAGRTPNGSRRRR